MYEHPKTLHPFRAGSVIGALVSARSYLPAGRTGARADAQEPLGARASESSEEEKVRTWEAGPGYLLWSQETPSTENWPGALHGEVVRRTLVDWLRSQPLILHPRKTSYVTPTRCFIVLNTGAGMRSFSRLISRACRSRPAWNCSAPWPSSAGSLLPFTLWNLPSWRNTSRNTRARARAMLPRAIPNLSRASAKPFWTAVAKLPLLIRSQPISPPRRARPKRELLLPQSKAAGVGRPVDGAMVAGRPVCCRLDGRLPQFDAVRLSHHALGETPMTRSKEQWRVTNRESGVRGPKSGVEARRRKCGRPCTLTINRAAHTTPFYRQFQVRG
jgi:hypothetical protein